jgi:hypothetical protein
MWRDVLMANREQVLHQSQAFRKALDDFEALMTAGDLQAIEQSIAAASKTRAAWKPATDTSSPSRTADMFSTAFLDLPPLAGAAGTVRLPGSKSISNRVLLLAALASGTTTIHDLLDSDDTRVMLDALRALGCGIAAGGEARCDHRPRRPAEARQRPACRCSSATPARPCGR